MKYKVGDKVHVSSSGDCFSTYSGFFDQNGLSQFKTRYKDGNSIHAGDYRIAAIGEHKTIPYYGTIYVLDNGTDIYIVGDYSGYLTLIEASLSTPEMFAKITEGESYQRISDGHIVTMKNGAYTWEPGRAKLSKDDLWVKAEDKEVSFLEAIKAYRDERKTIECRHKNDVNQYDPSKAIRRNNGELYIGVRDQNGEPPAAEEILNGKWFIKA